ncbi:membrane cofactor protein-like isoform X1 [Equus quagga]|uniref:membrane cofactor protein-like isoform X1 n=1 Tax=Equus quagga TaxID=89248 RepID=UPI001EE23808|nr:membrane cofactor protein-like isoform X1 [Equus quagga]XP_046537821.1 membrane cofactor protein-like isoform X1 [Equus quagga]
MMASCAPLSAPLCRPQSHFSSWCSAGILLGALVLPLPVSPSGTCEPPPTFETMQLKGKPDRVYFPGERLFYECRPAYERLFPYSLSTFCEHNGSWFPIEEACTRKKCPTPQLKYGEVTSPNSSYMFDSEAHFLCDEGYHLVGRSILTCIRVGSNVRWDDIIPQCELILCSPPGKIKNGKYTNSYMKSFEYNQFVTYSCNPSDGPEEYSLVGESQLTCSGPDTWSSDPPECKVVKCELPVLEHGRAVSGIREKFSYLAVVIFECLQDFYLNGSHIVFCGGNSTWEPEMPTCIKGFKPTHPTKPPVWNYPGYPNPREFLSLEDFEDLDRGIIALIVVTVVLGVAVVCTCLYRCLQREKKGEPEVITADTTKQDKPTAPAK